MNSKLDTLKTWVDEAERMVFFGGAGVSTESGIPDFRSVDGLYHQEWAYPPEEILSRSFFVCADFFWHFDSVHIFFQLYCAV